MYLRPTTLDEALEALALQGAPILSGGTDYFPALGDRPAGPLLDISGLSELERISRTDHEIRIGSRVTWSGLVAADLPPCFTALKQAAREVGSVQIQNAGTLAGNLCNASPAADGVPPLLVLDAEVELASRAGRRRVPLDRFILGNRATSRRPEELVTAIIVPREHAAARSAFLKLGARRFMVISIAMVAVLVEMDAAGRVATARVAVGSCAAVALRLPALEATLVGRLARPGLGALVQAGHCAPLSPIDDDRATAGYRRDAVVALVGRALDQCVREA